MSVILFSSNKGDVVCMVPASSLMMMILDKKCASGIWTDRWHLRSLNDRWLFLAKMSKFGVGREALASVRVSS